MGCKRNVLVNIRIISSGRKISSSGLKKNLLSIFVVTLMLLTSFVGMLGISADTVSAADTTTAFVSTWDTTKLGHSSSKSIKLPLVSTGTYDFTVEWGDGNSSVITSWNQAETTHTYASEGTYEVNITGTIQGFRFSGYGDRLKIINISQWGCLNMGNDGGYFHGCSNLNTSATDALNLTGTTSFENMFNGASSFNGNISN